MRLKTESNLTLAGDQQWLSRELSAGGIGTAVLIGSVFCATGGGGTDTGVRETRRPVPLNAFYTTHVYSSAALQQHGKSFGGAPVRAPASQTATLETASSSQQAPIMTTRLDKQRSYERSIGFCAVSILVMMLASLVTAVLVYPIAAALWVAPIIAATGTMLASVSGWKSIESNNPSSNLSTHR